MDGIKEFKTKKIRIDDFETDVLYWDEYKYLGITYAMQEIDTNQEMAIGELLSELNIDNLQSLNDITKIQYGKFISAALKYKVAPRFLSIVLKRVNKDGTYSDTVPEEFDRGLARLFNPFFKEVIVAFFYMNYAVFQPMVDAVENWTSKIEVLKNMFRTLMDSITSAAATSPSSKKSPKSRAA